MRPSLRSMALAGVLAVIGLAGFGNSPARAHDDFPQRPGGYGQTYGGGYYGGGGGGGYGQTYGGGYNQGFIQIYGGYNQGYGQANGGGYNQGYGGGYNQGYGGGYPGAYGCRSGYLGGFRRDRDDDDD